MYPGEAVVVGRERELEGDLARTQLTKLHQLGRQEEDGLQRDVALLAVHVDGVRGRLVWLQLRDVAGERGRTGGDVDVLHEAPTDEVVLVADAGGPAVVGREEEAGHFEAAGREDEGRGARGEGVPGERLHVDAGDRVRVFGEREPGHVRPEHELHVGGVHDLVAVHLSEHRATGELQDRVRCARALEEGLRDEALVAPVRQGVVVGAEADDVLGGGVERIEVGPGDRPARTGHVRPRLEVELGERAAVAGPVVGGAAEVAEARRVEPQVDGGVDGEADAPAPVERLGVVVEVEAAALEQEHGVSRVCQRAGERDACRAGADDAHVGGHGRARRNLAGVEQHPATRPTRPRPRRGPRSATTANPAP